MYDRRKLCISQLDIVVNKGKANGAPPAESWF